MPRGTITSAYRKDAESPVTANTFPIFAQITHPKLIETLNVAQDGDGIDYTWLGVKWVGMPFELVYLSDDDNAPKGNVSLINVSRKISDALRSITTPPRIDLFGLSRSDFYDTIDVASNTVLAIGTPTIQFQALWLRLRQVSVNSSQIGGTLQSWDFVSEPYPKTRATPGRCPGLFP